jgi:hypothetical protein
MGRIAHRGGTNTLAEGSQLLFTFVAAAYENSSVIEAQY